MRVLNETLIKIVWAPLRNTKLTLFGNQYPKLLYEDKIAFEWEASGVQPHP